MKEPLIIDHPEIQGLKSIKLDSFKDFRGQNFEICDANFYRNKLGLKFKLDSCSFSKRGVLRGLHGSNGVKLIQVLHGKIQFFVIDQNPESPTFNSIKELILDANDPTQIIVPKLNLTGHLVLKKCCFFYKWTTKYSPIKEQISAKWNDSRFNLNWLNQNPVLSSRDK